MLRTLALIGFALAVSTPDTGFAKVHHGASVIPARHKTHMRTQRWAARSPRGRLLKVNLPATAARPGSEAVRLDDAGYQSAAPHLAYESSFAPRASVSLGFERGAGSSQTDLIDRNPPAASMYQSSGSLVGGRLRYAF
jgi:hypothetical protein